MIDCMEQDSPSFAKFPLAGFRDKETSPDVTASVLGWALRVPS